MSKIDQYLSVFIALMLLTAPCFAEEKEQQIPVKKADIEKQISYALGYDIFEKLRDTIELDPEYFFKGAQDSQQKKPEFDEKEIQELLQSYQRLARQKQIAKIKEESAKNRAAGEKFLDENMKKEGVITTASGLQYKVIKEGSGIMPKETDNVECHYEGSLLDGTVFDSSYKRGRPAVFQVGGVIPGWVEALQKMKVGSIWMLYIPSNLAYGDRGAGPDIKPGDTLIFKVELLSIME